MDELTIIMRVDDLMCGCQIELPIKQYLTALNVSDTMIT
jgi:hypothetical protein